MQWKKSARGMFWVWYESPAGSEPDALFVTNRVIDVIFVIDMLLQLFIMEFVVAHQDDVAQEERWRSKFIKRIAGGIHESRQGIEERINSQRQQLDQVHRKLDAIITALKVEIPEETELVEEQTVVLSRKNMKRADVKVA